MADPRIVGPRDQKARLSPLMQAKGRVATGEKVNACPFGCEPGDLDEMGYCDHLVGFTNNSEKECKAGKGEMEPMGKDTQGRRKVFGADKAPVKKNDVLVQITTSYRVYREEPKAIEKG